MKKGIFRTLAMLALSLFAVTGQAAVVVVNDAMFGPGSVLRDSGTSLDYLRLDRTMGHGYAGVAAELGAGGDFAGWTFASSAQMLSLGGSLGLTHGSTSLAQLSLAAQLRDWFCPLFTCVNTSTTHVYARGLVSDLHTDSIQHLAFTIGNRFNVSPPEVDFRVSGYGSVSATHEEIFLVRAVPLPPAVWLFGAGLLGLVGVARKKN